MVEKWQRTSAHYLGDYRIFRLRQDERVAPRTGLTHTFYVLEAPDWINVIPVTPDGQVVMVRQFRHGTERVTVEIPAGMVDPEDPDPAAAVARELREETGYEADEIEHIGSVAPNPAFLDNQCHTYLARGARPTGPQQLEGAEDIDTVLLSLAEIERMIESGTITHSLTLNAFYWYERYRRSQASTD